MIPAAIGPAMVRVSCIASALMAYVFLLGGAWWGVIGALWAGAWWAIYDRYLAPRAVT